MDKVQSIREWGEDRDSEERLRREIETEQLRADAARWQRVKAAAVSGFSQPAALDFARAQARTFGAKSMLVTRDLWRAIVEVLEKDIQK